MTKRIPIPRVDLKRKLVCVYSTQLSMFEVCQMTNKGTVSKMFKPQVAFTDDVHKAFKRFTVPFARFRIVAGVKRDQCKTWNEWIERVWQKANQK
jgi:hypothetical protein